MPASEVAHRLAYAGYTALERQLYSRGVFVQPDRLRAALRLDVRGSARWEDVLLERCYARRFFAWQDDPQGFSDLFRSQYSEELEKARRIADRIARHEISFFGESFQFGPEIRWHADPVTGVEWPRKYHRDVDCSRHAGCGDIKYVWELNRQQFLTDLAKLAFLDRSRQHAAEVTALVESWLDVAPYGTGAPWACALEPAFRVWSWLWAYHMLLVASMLAPATHLRWLTGFLDHARFLYRHLEHYTSPYNHLVGEASALFALGLAFPEFRESRRWVRRGRRVLTGTVAAQFDADGGSVEQSTFYHHATLGFYILSAVLGRRHGEDLGTSAWAAIERGVEFSMALVQPDGRVPSIGGADDGKSIRLEHLPFWDFRPYYAIGAALFRRGDFKSAAGRFWEDALWVLGSAALQDFVIVPAEAPTTSRTLRESGYSVFRTSRLDNADYVLFDCGPQAAGLRRDGVPSAAHGHADCLSVIATLGGRCVLVDPGFYCYNGDPEWEVHFRRTAAHNTISVDGRDQARHVSKMAWTHTYSARLENSSEEGAVGWASGSHDGYADGGAGVIHRRAVWLREGGYIIILDELSGRRGGIGRANFQFAPGDLSLESSESALFAGQFELSWTSSAPVSATVVRRGESPSQGWIATSLGVRVPAPRLLLEFPLEFTPVLLLTVLADRQRAAQAALRRVSFPRLVPADGGPVLGAHISGAGWIDRLVAGTHGRATHCFGIDTDAALAIVRVNDRGLKDSCCVGGTYVRVREWECAPPLRASTCA